MSLGAYLVDGDRLTAMAPSAPPDEDRLQTMIESHPALVGRGDGALLLVAREQGVADNPETGARWSLDHLFVTTEAVPVLVEVKRAVDTRLRREVVGQLLDYAANGAAYWSEAQIQRAFDATCTAKGCDSGEALEEFLGDAGEADGFWRRVEANLRDGRLRMLIVADAIPPELARIIEFLNEQMRADVFGVELRHFQGTDGRLILVPRIVGETEQTRARKSDQSPEAIDLETWLDRKIGKPGSRKRLGAEQWLEYWRDKGAEISLSRGQTSLRAYLRDAVGGPGYPAHIVDSGRCTFDFWRARERDIMGSAEARLAFFDDYRTAFPNLHPLNPEGGWPGFPIAELVDLSKAEAYRRLADRWIAAWKGESK